MNVAPAQFHPNSWPFVRAFQIPCVHFDITPTANVFFFFFKYRASKRTSWASLNGIPGRGLLSLFQSSYKMFKGKFLKVHAPELLERFPLYWSPRPQCQSPHPDNVNNSELDDCKKLDDLGTIFETFVLLRLESRPSDIKVYIGTYPLHYTSSSFLMSLLTLLL